MKRRDFVKNTSIATSFVTVVPRIVFPFKDKNVDVVKESEEVLKGFIVSDAHFGWKHHDQPSPDTQVLMMKRIVERFPDLDIFFDTGDAHHGALWGDAGDKARGYWTDIISGGCGISPFYYIPGNHEIIGTLGEVDQEWRCNELGSISCRPYYSLDLKGIHFISLPELEQPVFINRESMEWLALDLKINKNKTIILLSHNNIKDTTTPMGEPGYRGITNSRELLKLFNRYPNVIAWMHGHNHSFEVVEKDGMLFVSNGRLGGFIPPPTWGEVGQGHLGGIYFEIREDRLIVRSYSASKDKFFDELGYPHLSGKINTKTTFNPLSPPSYSLGSGGMNNGQKIPVFNHHISSEGESELFLKETNSPVINDDSEFSFYEFRNAGKRGNQWMLMGTSVGKPRYFEKENTLWRWNNPGIRLLPQKNINTSIEVSIPDWQFAQYCYYRCVPGRKYAAILNLDVSGGGQELVVNCLCYDRNGNKLININGLFRVLEAGKNEYITEFDIPGFNELQTIYNDESSDNLIQIEVVAVFSKMKDEILIRRFELIQDTVHSPALLPKVAINGQVFTGSQDKVSGEILRLEVPQPSKHRTVIQTQSKGNNRLAWLIRHNFIEWQVRNATVVKKGNYFEIGPLRNNWTFLKEVIIAPMSKGSQTFVHRLRNVQKANIYPLTLNNKKLKVEIVECGEPAMVMIFSVDKPQMVEGVDNWYYKDRIISMDVKQNSNILITV